MCIFKSTPQNIANVLYKGPAAGRSEKSFALSDSQGSVFRAFTVKKSTRAAIAGTINMVLNIRKYSKMLSVSAMMKDTNGMMNVNKMRQLPADFLINEDGIIVDLFRAQQMSDHMPFERVEAIIPEEKRCRCNKKDCIVPRCRENYDAIRREAEAMIFCGGEEEGSHSQSSQQTHGSFYNSVSAPVILVPQPIDGTSQVSEDDNESNATSVDATSSRDTVKPSSEMSKETMLAPRDSYEEFLHFLFGPVLSESLILPAN